MDEPDDGDASTIRERETEWEARDTATDHGGESPDEDLVAAFFAVEGMHCTTCETFLSRRARRIDGVADAQASYATDTIRAQYDPDRIDADRIADRLSGYGYTAWQREADRTEDRTEHGLARFLVGGGLFGMMVMVWYGLFLYPTYFGYPPIVQLDGYERLYVQANIWLLSTFVLGYTGWPILRGALVSVRARLPNMDLLVALAAVSAYGYSTIAMLVGRQDLYFDVTVAIILVVTAGSYYERRIKRRAADRLSELTSERVDTARLADGNDRVPVETVEAGDRLLVRPGEVVPLDGEVAEGMAAVDESLLTGAARPESKGPGDQVSGGTVVTDGPLVVVVGEYAESTLDRLVELIWSVQSATPGAQRLADRLATVFVPLVLVLATAVAVLVALNGSPAAAALLQGLTVLIVACPCALGLATPLAVAAGVRSGTERGIVMTAENIFEGGADVDTIVLDKTGTLTAGTMRVTEIVADRPGEVLERAAAVEALSEHPIGKAIVARAERSEDAMTEMDPAGTTPNNQPTVQADPDGFDREPRGVSAPVGGATVVVGHPELLVERDCRIGDDLAAQIDEVRATGEIPVAVGWAGRCRGVIVVSDVPRTGWRAAIDTLAARHEIVVLTGDDSDAAERYRTVEGIDRVFAGVPPDGKVATIRRLQARGTVAMVGDGSNDAPALAAADLGIALGSGTQLATNAADVVVLDDELSRVVETFTITRRTRRRIRQNLAWAFVYNGVAIPLAVAGVLNPFLAAVAMATSSILVVANSSRSFGIGAETNGAAA